MWNLIIIKYLMYSDVETSVYTLYTNLYISSNLILNGIKLTCNVYKSYEVRSTLPSDSSQSFYCEHEQKSFPWADI